MTRNVPLKITRAEFVEEVRRYRGARFGHQGRRADLLDCGGLVLFSGRGIGLTTLEFLSYACFPTGGKFEQLLDEHAENTGFKSKYPHNFKGDEFLPGDLLSFDYGNGEGVRHIAVVTRWDGRRFRIIDALEEFGVSEHPLAHPFTKPGTVLTRYLVKGLVD